MLNPCVEILIGVVEILIGMMGILIGVLGGLTGMARVFRLVFPSFRLI